MKHYLYLLPMALIMMSGCSEDALENTVASGNGRITASFEQGVPKSRIVINDDLSLSWTANTDAFKVFGIGSSATYTCQSVTGTAGTFTGTEVTNPVGAAFPDEQATSLSDNTLTMTLPASIAKSSLIIPMYAKATSGSTDYSFKHLCAMLKVDCSELSADGYTSLVLTASAPISGTFTATVTEDLPVLASTSTQNADKKVTLSLSEMSTKVFYVPLPVGNYASLAASLAKEGEDTETSLITWTNKTFERAKIYTAKLKTQEVTGEITSVNTALASGVASTIEVTGAITPTESENTINVPSTGDVTLSFSEAPVTSTTALVFASENAASTEVGDAGSQFTIAMTAGSSTDEIVVNTPTTTVELASTVSGEETESVTTYNKVTATTAVNTLIVGDNVTVKSLIIKGGNVRVRAKGVISQISRDESNTNIVTVIVEDGATIPADIDSSVFHVVSVELAELEAAAQAGGSHTLQSDLTLGTPLVVSGTLTLDLNGHSIKPASEGLTKVLNTKDGVVLVRRGAQLTINDSSNGQGSIDASEVASVYAAVKLTDTNDGTEGDAATLIVNGGTLKGYYYAIVGNGTRHNTSVTVNGGTMEGLNGPGIYHPQEGTLAVTGGTITGVESGIELRSGTLNVSGGTIVSTATEFKTEANNSGTTVTGAAIAVSQHTTNKAISVSITGGTMEGIYAFYEVDLQDESVENIAISSASSAVFKGKIYSENCTGFITGGTFSDPSALQYLGEGADVTVNLTADTTLDSSMIIERGSATIDLGNHTLTAGTGATITIGSNLRTAAIAVKDGAKVTVQNGTIGDSSSSLFYGVYAFGSADVTLSNVAFGEYVTYAYNGAGKLTASGCTFRGWLSGWSKGAAFTDCTFTIGKAYYPAAICYGSTTFTSCKFFKNNVDADTYDDSGNADGDGYYRCNYVVAGCNPATTIDFVTCKFIDESNNETNVSASDHPYHACGWGDGQVANAQIKVDDTVITSQCTDASASTTTESTEG